MADKLEKKILPVSFVDNWPPDCLAIQLATIQYIHAYQGHTDYHDDEGYSEDLPKHDDIPCSPLHTGTKKWDPRHVKRVADNIYKIFKAECDKERKNNMRKSVKRISSMKVNRKLHKNQRADSIRESRNGWELAKSAGAIKSRLTNIE